MDIKVKKTDYFEARKISTWIYKNHYSIYSMSRNTSCIRTICRQLYYSATDNKGRLLGYYCFGEAAQVSSGIKLGIYNNKDFTDIGLALKPDLCGRGLGLDFLNCGLQFARDNLSAKSFRLTVASFNKAAIKVYEKAGFHKVTSFKIWSRNMKIEFWVMTLK